mmetsp:Transcript_15508/g.27535  ORF Transcript_15508/g.27535 Transcript_15508/m.27535 type:complete len:85 (-) Transcript_15508:382-636(-)
MAFDSEFKEELRNLSENEVHLPFGPFDLVTPTSGWYQGMTSESDGAAQSVRPGTTTSREECSARPTSTRTRALTHSLTLAHALP